MDFTESLTGEVKYEAREMEFVFVTLKARKQWTDLYSDILDYLHGQEMKIILDENPDYYYIGRVSVNEWKSSEKYSTIVINAKVDPYKYELFSSLDDWEWDKFNFESGVIREYQDIRVDESLDFTINGTRKSVVPTFIVKSDDGTGMNVEFEDVVYEMSDGENRILYIIIKDGENTLHFVGNGTVSIDYRGGRL
ncbi:MAG: mtfA protein [Bariatricus sp.]